jgi:PRC-barrel domain
MNRFLYFVAANAVAAILLAPAAFAQYQTSGTPPTARQAAAPDQTAAPKATVEGILGSKVVGAGGEDMGLVTDVLVDGDGNPVAAVIDFGGFLGVGSRKIAIDWHLIQFHPGDKDKPVTLSLEKAQLQAAPEYKADAPPRIVGAPSSGDNGRK